MPAVRRAKRPVGAAAAAAAAVLMSYGSGTVGGGTGTWGLPFSRSSGASGPPECNRDGGTSCPSASLEARSQHMCCPTGLDRSNIDGARPCA
ncbi:hypothetical protein PSU4_19250 [Pseudonocardia sulfidoxydans NBRC 16205]|uniref:Uncharacterized protein n=1 Tax=Pseudonocardia sulfidoxydans NBRC 16205 TaxID=1223511 RepID=A0A511DDT6_9PSEU|nr:hypothetical protein PSU4_19250 [Pseudonocardia sulfidoxydans NBRC 16205]